MKNDLDPYAENEALRSRLAEYEDTLAAIRDGHVDALVGGHDVFLLESSEAASNRFRGQVLSQINDVVVATDADGCITYLNPPAEQQYRVRASDKLGFPLSTLYTQRFAHPGDEEAYHKALAQFDHWRGEHVHVKPDGTELPVESSVSVLRDANGRPVGHLAVVRDISQRVQIQRTLEETARQKDHFLATLAHELRNPLSPLTNGLELLKMSEGDAQVHAHSLGMMQRQLTQLVRLVDDLMDVSRISRGKLTLRKERTALDTVLHTAVEAGRPLIDAKGHRLHVSVPSTELLVHGDPTRLTQIVTNLLNNAAKYTPDGGRIDLTLERQDGEAVIRVKDNGIGIEAPVLGRMFDLFVQADQEGVGSGGGLGIGLNIAKRLTLMHHGRLEGHSMGSGKGSTFTLHLPLLRTESDNDRSALDPDATDARHYRILVVDDNRDAAFSMGSILRKGGHTVEVSYDGQHALSLGKDLQPDLVIMDIGMPLMNGYETCERMRLEPWGRTARVVALSGWGQEQDRLRSLEAGFDDHIVKPIDIVTLRRIVDSLPATAGGTR